MAGMTDSEIKAREIAIHEGADYFWEMTPETIRELHELSCRSMINSCLVYGSASYDFYDGTRLVGYGLKYGRPLDCDKCTPEQNMAYVLSDDRVVELFKEQQERFRHARVHCAVHTDSDGCTYNSVDWDVN